MPVRGALGSRAAAIALGAVVCWLAGLTAHVEAARAGTVTMTSCSAYYDNGLDTDVNGPVWAGSSNPVGAFDLTNNCPQGGRSFKIAPAGTTYPGQTAQWSTITPPSMEIVGANSYPNGVYVDPLSGDYFNTSFFWNGGTQTIYPTGGGYGTAINRFLGPSRYFGWQVTCRAPGGQTCGDPNSILAVRGIQLVAIDTTAPGILPTGAQ